MWSTDPPTKPGHYWAVCKAVINSPYREDNHPFWVAMIMVCEDYKGDLKGWGIGGEDGGDTAFELDRFSHWLPVEQPDLPDSLLPDSVTEATS